jgi:type IX secretion system substrate protein
MKYLPFCPKKSLLFALLVFTVTVVNAQICSNPNGLIYGLSNSGNIVPITVNNTSVGSKINVGFTSSTSNANAIGYNPLDGKFYFFENGNSGASELFVSYDPVLNVYATLAAAPISGAVNRGCISFNGTGYYCLDASSNLCYYNIPSNTWTLIGSVYTDQYNNNVTSTFNAQGSGDMAIDGIGNLWIVSSNASNYGVYKISAPLPTAITASISVTQLVAPTTATPAGTNFAGIAFNATGSIYVSTPNELYILNNDLSLSHLGTFSVGGSGADLTSCNFPVSVLPVVWENFSVTLQDNHSVVINWVVSRQTDNKEYNVERSSDGKNWSSIGVVANEDSYTASQSYSLTDANPLSGNNYYRIRQDDINGKVSYSAIKTVNAESTAKVAVWPNPAKNIINIQQENSSGMHNINAEIFNQSGQKVASGLLHNGINTVNIESLPAGYYIVHIDVSNGEKYNQKIIKQ